MPTFVFRAGSKLFSPGNAVLRCHFCMKPLHFRILLDVKPRQILYITHGCIIMIIASSTQSDAAMQPVSLLFMNLCSVILRACLLEALTVDIPMLAPKEEN